MKKKKKKKKNALKFCHFWWTFLLSSFYIFFYIPSLFFLHPSVHLPFCTSSLIARNNPQKGVQVVKRSAASLWKIKFEGDSTYLSYLIILSSRHSSMVATVACYCGGPGFESRQGRVYFQMNSNIVLMSLERRTLNCVVEILNFKFKF